MPSACFSGGPSTIGCAKAPVLRAAGHHARALGTEELAFDTNTTTARTEWKLVSPKSDVPEPLGPVFDWSLRRSRRWSLEGIEGRLQSKSCPHGGAGPPQNIVPAKPSARCPGRPWPSVGFPGRAGPCGARPAVRGFFPGEAPEVSRLASCCGNLFGAFLGRPRASRIFRGPGARSLRSSARWPAGSVPPGVRALLRQSVIVRAANPGGLRREKGRHLDPIFDTSDRLRIERR